jgi:hypothetical protein
MKICIFLAMALASASATKLTFELDGCRTRGGGKCVEGRNIGDHYKSQGARFFDTRNVATGWSSSGGPPHGFAAANGPHSGWGTKPMTISFVKPGTSTSATVDYFGGHFIGPSCSVTVKFYNFAGKLIDTKTVTTLQKTTGFTGWKVNGVAKVVISGSSYAVDDVTYSTPKAVSCPAATNPGAFRVTELTHNHGPASTGKVGDLENCCSGSY